MIHKQIRHYRIPLYKHIGKIRGKPKSNVLHWYVRGEGFVSLAKDTSLSSRGGMTICYIYEDKTLISTGRSKCSYADNFNYKIGRDIAVGRAEKELVRAQAKGEK